MNEIHITVPQRHAGDLQRFVANKFPPDPRFGSGRSWSMKICNFVNHAEQAPLLDTFTTEPCSGSVERAQMVASNREDQFRNAGIEVARIKIECEPWDHERAVPPAYYESHLNLVGVQPGEWRVGVRGLLLSTNLRKRKVWGTVRSTNSTLDQHMNRVHRVTRGLLANRISVLEVQHEYVSLDTNRDHDRLWEATLGQKD